MKLTRAEAIEMVAQAEVKDMPRTERAERLEVIGFEGWEDEPAWQALPLDLRRELRHGDVRTDPASARYDAALAMTVLPKYAGVRNEYLVGRLRQLGVDCSELIGCPVRLAPCPCCGCRTLSSRGDYEICRVCWWEDDGQDDAHADESWGGPSGDLSLTAARRNFVLHGIFDPRREDLRKHQDPIDMFERARVFGVDENGVVVESELTAD